MGCCGDKKIDIDKVVSLIKQKKLREKEVKYGIFSPEKWLLIQLTEHLIEEAKELHREAYNNPRSNKTLIEFADVDNLRDMVLAKLREIHGKR